MMASFCCVMRGWAPGKRGPDAAAPGGARCWAIRPSAGGPTTPGASAAHPAWPCHRPSMWRAAWLQGTPLAPGAPCRPPSARSTSARSRGRAGIAEETCVPLRHAPGVVVGLAADHHAVDMLQMLGDLLIAGDAAVEHDGQRREVGLQPVHHLVAQRRHLAVFLRAQALQPGVARVHDEDAAAAASATVPTKSRTKS